MTTVWALFVGVADGFDAETPTLQVVVVALISEEFAVTECAELRWSSKLTRLQWLFGFNEIGAVFASAGGAPFTIAGMLGHIVVIEPTVTVIAEVGSAEESTKEIAAIVVIVFLDETNDLARRSRGSSKNDHVRWVNGHDLDLVPRQGGLKLLELRETARAFRDSSKLVKFLGFSFLGGVALFEIVVVLVSGIPVGICQSFHRDDGACTTEVVLILHGDARPFHDTAYSSTARSVPFSIPTARSRGAYEGGFHGESVIRGEFFVGVEFACKGLEIRVQSFTSFFKFTYGKSGRLEGVGEGTGLHGVVDRGMRRQGVVSGNLLLDGTLKSVG